MLFLTHHIHTSLACAAFVVVIQLGSGSAHAQICAPLYSDRDVVVIDRFDRPIEGAGHTWIRTAQAVHAIGQDGQVRTWRFDEATVTIAAIGNSVWVGTTAGAYRFGQSGNRIPVGPRTKIVTIAEMFGTTLLFGDRDVYVARDDAVDTIALPPGRASILGGPPYWVVTTNAVYRVTSLTAKPAIFPVGAPPNALAGTPDELWIGTDTGLFIFTAGSAVPRRPAIAGPVRALSRTDGGDTWIVAATGVFLARAGQPVPARPELSEGGIRSILAVNRALIYTDSSQRAHRLELGNKKGIPLPTVPSSVGEWAYEAATRAVWMPTDGGIYRYDAVTGGVTSYLISRQASIVSLAGQSVWIGGSTGAGTFYQNICRLELGLTLTAVPEQLGRFQPLLRVLDTRFLLGDSVRLRPEFSCAANRQGCEVAESLRAISGSQLQIEVLDASPAGNWKESVERHVPSLPDIEKLPYTVRNRLTNDVEKGGLAIVAISHQRAAALVILTSFAIAFLAVPWSRTAFWVLFGLLPRDGKAAYFNLLVPITANVNILRQHILRRYRSHFLAATLKAPSRDAVVTRIVDAIKTPDTLQKRRLLKLVGEPANVKSRLEETGAILAGPAGGWTWLRLGRLPIRVDLLNYPDGNLAEAFRVQLARFGLEHTELASQLFKRGRVVFLIERPDKLKDASAAAELLRSVLEVQDNVAVIAWPTGVAPGFLMLEESHTEEIFA